MIQAKAKLAAAVLTPAYAKRKMPVTMADIPITQRRPNQVFTRERCREWSDNAHAQFDAIIPVFER